MKGSTFAQTFGPKGFNAWEKAAVEVALQGGMVDPGWQEITIPFGSDVLSFKVQADVFAVGEPGDLLRLPLSPESAQEIANANGWLLETPLIAFYSWLNARYKLDRLAMTPNKGASMAQFVEHSNAIDSQLPGAVEGAVAGHKKAVVISNAMKPGKVVIFGWYKPSPVVFDDRTPMTNPERQPRQPLSNIHGSKYVDYSHGIRFVHGTMLLNGIEVLTEDVLKHPSLSKAISHEGPLRQVRYPARNNPVIPRLSSYFVPSRPRLSDFGLERMVSRNG